MDLTWPLPPDPPRIQYVGQIESQYSIGFKHTFWERFKSTVLGIEPSEIVNVYRPFDSYVNDYGQIYLTDASRPLITVFNPGEKTAQTMTPRGDGTLAKPMGITGDANGYIYVADPIQRRVVKYDRQGEFIQAFGGRNVLLNPVDVAVSPISGDIYVVDSYLHQVLIFDSSGRLTHRIGKDQGNLAEKNDRQRQNAGLDNAHRNNESSDLVENRSKDQGAFHYPAFIATAPDGTLYVSDGMNFRVQAFDPRGEYLFQFGFAGDTPGSFARPKDIAVDAEGHVYVVDAAFNNIQIFNNKGELLLAFASLGGGPGDLYLPIGISIDYQNRIYVADRYNNRIQIYQYMPLMEEASPPSLTPASHINN